MLTKYWKQFQSGTDIRGVASEGVPGEKITLTDEAVERMARGFALWLERRAGKAALTVSVGHKRCFRPAPIPAFRRAASARPSPAR